MQTILRYLSKEKFKWLLSDNGIYVASAFAQSDIKEGVFDHTIVSTILKHDGRLPLEDNQWESFDNMSFDMMEINRKESYLTSWYLGNEETSKMWSEYAKDGIILVSNTYKLMDTLPQPLTHAASFYEIIYDDNKKRHSLYDSLKYKSKEFYYENEFRLVIDLGEYSIFTGYEKEIFGEAFVGDLPSYKSPEITSCMSQKSIEQAHSVIAKKANGYIIKFDLNQLLTEIRLNPNYSKEEESEIRNLCADNGLLVPIKDSQFKVS